MTQGDRPPIAAYVIGGLALVKLALHVTANVVTPYEFHRDELLYFAMGDHLDFWRMDFPPAIALASRGIRALLGDGLPAIRLVPALAGSALVVLAGLIARELGGGRTAQAITAIAVIGNPLFLRSANLFQPVVLDQLAWTLGFYALVRLLHTDDRRWWVGFGAAAGLGLLAKFSIAVFGVAVLGALLVTPHRRWLARPDPWLAAGLALAIGLPSVMGQIALDFPVVGQLGDLRASQLARVTAAEFFTGQLLFGPGSVLAGLGVGALLLRPRLRGFRLLGWTAVLTVVLLLALRGKPYYLGPIYPTMFAAGAVALDAVRPRGARLAARWVTVALVAVYTIVALPVGLPILAPERMARYAERLGITAAVRTNRGTVGRLPQDYADMLGWKEQAEAVTAVYRALPPEDRARAVVLGANYGEAGALEFYGPRLGLPRPVSPTGSYWFFGPGDKPGDVLVTIGLTREDIADRFGRVVEAARVTNAWAVEEEQDLRVLVASDRHPDWTLQTAWPTFRGRN